MKSSLITFAAVFFGLLVSCDSSQNSTEESTSTVETPTFNLLAANRMTYKVEQSLIIQCATPGAEIHYTLDGSDASAASPVYTNPVVLHATTTVSAIGIKYGMHNSYIYASVFRIVIDTPMVGVIYTSIPSGKYTSAQEITLGCASSGANIYYTLDGTEPSANSTLYVRPFRINKSTTLKAVAMINGAKNSPINTVIYRLELPCNNIDGVNVVTDCRDSQAYRTTVIGNQTWLAANLNFKGLDSVIIGKCVDGADSNCVKFGRLYNWDEVMNGEKTSSAAPSGVRGICLYGWHVPSDSEWTQLTTFVGDEATAGVKLKSTTGWNSINGTDLYGFNALRAAGVTSSGFVSWWTSTTAPNYFTHEIDGTMSWKREIMDNSRYIYRYAEMNSNYYGLRCIKD